ncbi:MAG: TraR/DksA family transcriptional regulator [Gammaproteobacteria bacterium]|nr:TraR/DksA family transcriptional regulator [Gammaproteobacteria bacterium]MCP4089154.1 TraR/DksA family transcriptional regulator [Gammaproteobacteria bacterium]MCP4276822.1 TraR/DksA family transcriptional regulator [Gammaproteobacteria bacterium]MCP4830665.1 TraR/DksA family transcriptional regulator [Gammaproteobacteria bacterium]MCP4928474.1 TraR/DksA family transcriptional regulator [Gammaproteobacteria bacterium]
MDFFRNKLISRQKELVDVQEAGRESAITVELDQARVGRLSRMDAMQAQAMSQASNRRRDAELYAIKTALIRIDTGEYGNCFECGEPINPQRLKVQLTVRHCINCAGHAEASGG